LDHCIDEDVVARRTDLARERLRQGHQSRLRGRIARSEAARILGLARDKVDHPPVALGFHLTQDNVRADRRADEVHLDLLDPLRNRLRDELPAVIHSRVVHQHVDAPEAFDRRLHRACDIGVRAYVAKDGQQSPLAPRPLHARAVERNDERTVLEEARCERAADPTSCAGDHHDFALERLHDVMSLLSK
jgi:hypothetical protein